MVMNGRVCRIGVVLMLSMLLAEFRSAAQQPKPDSAPPASAQQTTSAPSNPAADNASASKPVLKVGGQSVTRAEMDFLIRNLDPQTQKVIGQQGLRALGDRYALMLVLAQDGVSKHLDETEDFRRELAAQRNRMLAQVDYQELAKSVSVTDQEISQYYATHGADFDDIQVRQIAVRTKPQDAKEGTPGLTADEGRARLEAIKKALASGADPKQVAKDFGIPNQVLIETEARTLRQGPTLPEFQRAAFKLKDGEFTEIEQVGTSLAILQVVGRHHPELKDVSQQIQNLLRQQKLDDQIAQLKNKAAIWMDETYFTSPQVPAPGSTPPTPEGTQPTKP